MNSKFSVTIEEIKREDGANLIKIFSEGQDYKIVKIFLENGLFSIEIHDAEEEQIRNWAKKIAELQVIVTTFSYEIEDAEKTDSKEKRKEKITCDMEKKKDIMDVPEIREIYEASANKLYDFTNQLVDLIAVSNKRGFIQLLLATAKTEEINMSQLFESMNVSKADQKNYQYRVKKYFNNQNCEISLRNFLKQYQLASKRMQKIAKRPLKDLEEIPVFKTIFANWNKTISDKEFIKDIIASMQVSDPNIEEIFSIHVRIAIAIKVVSPRALEANLTCDERKIVTERKRVETEKYIRDWINEQGYYSSYSSFLIMLQKKWTELKEK